MQEYEIGQKVMYNTGEVGVVFGIRRNEAGEVIEYLIDTGRDEFTNEITRDLRSEEIGKRLNDVLDVNPEIGDDMDSVRAVIADIDKQPDLPPAGMNVEIIRQPEQAAVLPENITVMKED